MNQSEFVLVEYIGLKPQRADHTYGTGLVWNGPGDVQPVPVAKWSAMRKHVDVWREVRADGVSLATPQAATTTVSAPAPAPTVASNPPAPAPAPVEAPVALETLTRDVLYTMAVDRGLKPNVQLGKPKLLELLKAKTKA